MGTQREQKQGAPQMACSSLSSTIELVVRSLTVPQHELGKLQGAIILLQERQSKLCRLARTASAPHHKVTLHAVNIANRLGIVCNQRYADLLSTKARPSC